MKTKKKRIKKHYSDAGMARAFFDQTLAEGIVSVGNSCFATPDRFWAFDTTFAARTTIPVEKGAYYQRPDNSCFLVRHNTCEPAYVLNALHNAMRRSVADRDVKYTHFYRRSENDSTLFAYGVPILEVAKIVPNTSPSDWRADWVSTLQRFYESYITNRVTRRSIVYMVANYWNHVNVANNTLKYLGLPQLTRDEVQVSRLEDAIAVEMFKRKADGEETGHYYSNDYYRHQTPEFLKAA